MLTRRLTTKAEPQPRQPGFAWNDDTQIHNDGQTGGTVAVGSSDLLGHRSILPQNSSMKSNAHQPDSSAPARRSNRREPNPAQNSCCLSHRKSESLKSLPDKLTQINLKNILWPNVQSSATATVSRCIAWNSDVQMSYLVLN